MKKLEHGIASSRFIEVQCEHEIHAHVSLSINLNLSICILSLQECNDPLKFDLSLSAEDASRKRPQAAHSIHSCNICCEPFIGFFYFKSMAYPTLAVRNGMGG